MKPERRVAVVRTTDDLKAAVYAALEQSGVLARVANGARVALKPNFTYPYYKRGVTTSPQFIRAAVEILRDYTSRLAIVETDGGYGLWKATEAFDGHGMYALRDLFGVEVVNLCDEPSEPIEFISGRRLRYVRLPARLLHDTDLMISMPVPKIHSMTGLTLGYKNQWGCIPDTMRLRRHHMFNDAIIAINQTLKPAILGDGTFFLDNNGPMAGTPVRMDLAIGASDAGAFDRYVSELMKFPWRKVSHLRVAVAKGDMPATLAEIACNVAPDTVSSHVFRLQRTPRNWLALMGFKSRTVTWLGYESWFGKHVLHPILYMFAERPVAARPDADL